MDQLFSGRKLVVIGGTSGIGRQVATDVVAGGGTAVVLGRRQSKVEDTVAALSSTGTAFGITADLLQPGEREKAQAELAADHSDATLLVNAAGVFLPKPFLEHTETDYDQYLDLNRATFFLTQTVAKAMIASGRGGAIVNIGSMWAQRAIAATPSSAYSMAEAGLHAHDSAPGPCQRRLTRRGRHPLYEGFIEPAEVARTPAGFNAFHPSARIRTSKEASAVITFLLSDQTEGVTGALWDVDGGVMASRNQENARGALTSSRPSDGRDTRASLPCPVASPGGTRSVTLA